MPQRHFGSQNQHSAITIDQIPDQCPICHSSICPTETGLSLKESTFAEAVFRCPNQKCLHFFTVRYELRPFGNGNIQGFLKESFPKVHKGSNYSQIISDLSPSYVRIVGQAEAAEAHGLDEISGVGYRRSLEFLVKDYLISRHVEAAIQDDIRKQMLGRCIEKYIKNENIKLVAKRAAWLGNDETHYVRKWEDKDIRDLKKLIVMTVAWIEIEQLTIELEKEMPDPNSAT